MAYKDKTDLLKEAIRCFRLVTQAEAEQRKREKEDLRFQVPEFQWDDAALQARRGGTQGSLSTPPRPILSVSLVQQPMQLVQNQAAAADLGVNIHPVSELADEELAEIKQGLYRRIERDSNAEQVRLWAFDRAKQCGRGWYRVITQWDDEGDDPSDQEIVIKRILHQDCVYMDPAAQEPDFSDAEWAFVTSWVPRETFKRLYPKAKLSEATSDLEFSEYLKDTPEWVDGTGEETAYLVAEYFYKEHEYEEIKYGDKQTRKKDKVSVKWCKLNAAEVLEEGDWNGKHIPLIPVIGRELQPFDSERRFEGMVRPARDGQRAYNFSISTFIERMALEPKIPWVGPEGFMEGHEAEWQQSNVRNLVALQYKATTIQGTQTAAPPPQRAQLDSTGMSLAMMGMQESRGLVQSATAMFDPSLGETPKRGQSGRSVIAQQQQADAGTSNYLQNLANISMPYEAKVVLDLIPAIYDRPGRVTEILGGEDEKSKKVMLNAPFIPDETGHPQPAPESNPRAKVYDLSKGKYSISVSIGKSYQTRLQQGQESMGELMQHLPPEAQALLLPVYMKFLDSPGSKEAAEIMTKYRDQHFPGLTDDEGQAPTPQQLQSQIQAMQQKGQEQAQQLQMAVEQIKTDQAKQQAMIQKAQIDAQKEIQLQQMKNAASIAVAQINAQAKIGMSATEDENEALATGLQHAHEAEQAEQDRAHEAAMAAQTAQMPELGQPQPSEPV